MVISAGATAAITYWGHTSIIRTLQSEFLRKQVDTEISRIELAIVEASNDIQFIADLPLIKMIGDLAESGTDPLQSQEVATGLVTIFESILQSKPNYTQIRLIGQSDRGRELARVHRDGGEIVAAEPTMLQEKGHHSYFQNTPEDANAAPYFSKINLNREFNEIESPPQPTLRVSLPVFDSAGNYFGIVVINIDFDSFISTLLERSSDRYVYFLTNSEGYFLAHPNEDKTFAFDRGDDDRIQNEFPQLESFYDSEREQITARMSAGISYSSDLIHFQKFQPFTDDRFLVFGISAKYDDIAKLSASVNAWIITLIIFLVLLGSVGAYLLSSRLTRPLDAIALASTSLSSGNDLPDLPTDRDDEIGDLARAYENMNIAISTHEAELQATNSKLLRATEDLEHFSHISSHELREPIRRIAGLVNLLKMTSSDKDDEDRVALLDSVESECTRAMQQIHDFRTFSRIGDQILLREPTDMEAVATEVLEDFSDEIKRRNISVHIDPIPPHDSYKNLIYVLYRNLIENAFRHVHEAPFKLQLSFHRQNNESIYSVQNTGSSIPREHRDTVFNLFTRLDKNGSGSGTGLTICKRIVERHSGRIWTESDGKSVTVYFTLESNQYGQSASDFQMPQ